MPLPEWMYPPREEGWFADDLDTLVDAPRHTELWDGALIFNMAPQKRWHGRIVTHLTVALEQQAPREVVIDREFTIRLDDRNRLEPDVIATRGTYEPGQTWLAAADVVLVVEVISPESKHRDRTVKLRKYAEAGIPHYWVIDDEPDGPAVHLYELDEPTGQYAPAGVTRGRLQTTRPFPIDIDLSTLA